jgi:pseudouridine-5'-phosphate glycosidase
MPFPQNLETAQEVESIIRKEGAIPATIALMDGLVHVGLDSDQLLRLAKSRIVAKTSRRDVARVLQGRGIGATTVSGTMLCAHRAGIPIFVYVAHFLFFNL